LVVEFGRVFRVDHVDAGVVHLADLRPDEGVGPCGVEGVGPAHESPLTAVISDVTLAAKDARSPRSPRRRLRASNDVFLLWDVPSSMPLLAMSISSDAASWVSSS